MRIMHRRYSIYARIRVQKGRGYTFTRKLSDTLSNRGVGLQDERAAAVCEAVYPTRELRVILAVVIRCAVAAW